MNRQLIQLLTWKVEQCIGRPLVTPKDFEHLINLLPQQDMLSMSTLKRVWNYVPNEHTPRENTLSILARFIGHKDWDDFCRQYTATSDSVFLADAMKIDDLKIGDEVLLEWMPDRSCLVKKIASDTLLVTETQNSKLQAGDTFSTVWLAVGLPLYASRVTRNETALPDYVAGRRKGLTRVVKRK